MSLQLENLKSNILTHTAQYKFPQSKTVNRTIHIILSTNMITVHEWYQKWFPDSDENVSSINPWIVFKENDEIFKKELKNSILATFDIELYNSLSENGYELIETVNQFIIVCDLTEKNIYEKIQTVFDVYDDILREFSTKQTPLFLTGLFQIRSVKKDAEDLQIIYPEDFESIMAKCSEKFDRIFTVDISNSQGVFINDIADLHIMIGQLIYFLRKRPIDFYKDNNIQGFYEWLKSSFAAEGLVSGISPISLVLPMDEIIELCIVKKGAQLLEHAFVNEFDQERLNFYYNSFTNDSNVFSEDILMNKFEDSKDFELINPLSLIKEFNSNNDEECLQLYENINDSIDRIINQNEVVLKEHSRKIVKEFSYHLDEHLQFIMTGELGCISLAGDFLNKIENHLNKLFAEININTTDYDDPDTLINRTERKLKKGPNKLSVFFRSVLWMLVFFIGVIQFWNLNFQNLLIISGFLISSIVIPFIYWHSSKTIIERKILNIENLLREKWSIVKKSSLQNITKITLSSLLKIVKEKKSEVLSTEERVEKIISFFRNEYEVSLPEEYSNWRYLVKKSSDMDKFEKLLDVNLYEIAHNYLKEKPLEFWKRFNDPSVSDLNDWEKEISEKAFLQLLPFINEILNLSICEVINEKKETFKNLINFIIRASQPFINLKPIAKGLEKKIITETNQIGCEGINDQLKEIFLEHFRKIEKRKSESLYRISFWAFLDNIDFHDVKIHPQNLD